MRPNVTLRLTSKLRYEEKNLRGDGLSRRIWPNALVDAKIRASDDLSLQVAVTGMHLSPEFGHTAREIEDAGFLIDEAVEMLLALKVNKLSRNLWVSA